MNYKETLAYLFSQLPMYQRVGKSAYKANLDNTVALDAYFKHPHKSFMTIHVAGTNGKGSVSHMLASILKEAGLKTGLYTSPHLVDFRERVKINGECITEEEVVSFVSKNKEIIEKIKPSFFEMTVAMAFNYFKEQGVDIAIIEVGMGGRLDSTNIIEPLVSIITNIGYDHTQFLGDSLEQIAREKAGIIKENIPIIIGECRSETEHVFLEIATQRNAPICFSERRFTVRNGVRTDVGQEFTVKNEQSGTTFNISLDLLGAYQQKNIIPVFGALQVLTPHLSLPKNAIISGLSRVIENTKLRGRWQIMQHDPKVICDTGHNSEGLILVLEQLKQETYKKLFIVLGVVEDKDIRKIMKLFPVDATYLFTQASIPRALPSHLLADIAFKEGYAGKSYPNVERAYKAALDMADAQDLIFVGGSTFVVADLIGYLDSMSS